MTMAKEQTGTFMTVMTHTPSITFCNFIKLYLTI